VSGRPTPRRAAAGCWWRGRVWLFGGCSEGDGDAPALLDDLWSLDPVLERWQRHAAGPLAARPAARRFASLAAGPHGLHLFGGSGTEQGRASFRNDLWHFDGVRWQLLQDTREQASPGGEVRPSGRYTASLERVEDDLWLFGGWRRDAEGARRRTWLNDLWRYDLEARRWECVEAYAELDAYDAAARRPGNRYGQRTARLGRRLYLFGGLGHFRDRSDLWELDTRTRRWRLLCEDGREDGPAGRYGHAMAAVDGALWIFGGRSRRDPRIRFADLWRYDLRGGRWEDRTGAVPGGPGRYLGKSALAAAGGVLHIVSGETERGGRLWHSDEAWSLDLRRERWRRLVGPAGLGAPIDV